MSSCTTCGQPLGAGRFCTHCGAAVVPGEGFDDWRTDTAERALPTVTAPPSQRTPPTAVAPPPPPRYPLYADEVAGWSADDPLIPHAEPVREPEGPIEWERHDGYDEDYDYDEERRSPVLWILAVVVVLVLVAGGWWFLVRDDGSGSARDSAAQDSPADAAAATETDLARTASVSAPSTAPPTEDADGRQVSFDASNMLDGVPTTAWRTPGDAKGTALTFTLPGPAELVQVGMINGYAKKATDDTGRTFDWYLSNRRVNAVVWTFDDGTKVRQQLDEDRQLQLLDLPAPVTTTTVVATLVRVSPPADGDAGRNFTAVSEVALVGTPAA